MSSGASQRDSYGYRVCDWDHEPEGCEFDGEIDLLVDPEANAVYWTCPRGHEHEEVLYRDW